MQFLHIIFIFDMQLLHISIAYDMQEYDLNVKKVSRIYTRNTFWFGLF